MSRIMPFPHVRPSSPEPEPVEVAHQVESARLAQADWGTTPLKRRLAILREFRARLAERGLEVAATVQHSRRRSPAETLTSEVLPLADACRFLEKRAPSLLRSRPIGRRGRSPWIRGLEIRTVREPLGTVLVIGPANYPLFLPAVQALQALTAGNSVLVKPGHGGRAPIETVRRLLLDSGLPAEVLQVLPEAPVAARLAIDAEVDKVLLTGSAETGRSVLERSAPHLTPSTMELSGTDAVFVLEDADLDRVSRALSFGLELNGSATCIAPRRVFVQRRQLAELEALLVRRLRFVPPTRVDPESLLRLQFGLDQALDAGGRLVYGTRPLEPRVRPLVVSDGDPRMDLMQADLFVPVLTLCPVDGHEDALRKSSACRHALGASIFGSTAAAQRLARRVDAGVVVINDLIVPTADPRVAFGGRRQSGFGLTRGAEGLLELTHLKTVVVRRGRSRPHYTPLAGGEDRIFAALLRALHSRGLGTRVRAAVDLFSAGRALIRNRRRTP